MASESSVRGVLRTSILLLREIARRAMRDRTAWIVVLLPLLSLGWVWSRPGMYTTTLTFLPQTAGAGRAAGLAAQFGISVGSGDQSMSPGFYVALIRTDPVLAAAAQATLAGSTERVHERLVPGGKAPEAVSEATRLLRDRLFVQNNADAGTVTVRYRSANPAMAYAIVTAVRQEILQFDEKRRQSQSRQERVFLETQVAAAEQQLAMADRAVVDFLTKNRSIRESPILQSQLDGLQLARQQARDALVGLMQSLQQARLSEVRDTPVISEVVSPVLAAVPEPKRPGLYFAAALALALVVVTVWHLLVMNRDLFAAAE